MIEIFALPNAFSETNRTSIIAVQKIIGMSTSSLVEFIEQQ